MTSNAGEANECAWHYFRTAEEGFVGLTNTRGSRARDTREQGCPRIAGPSQAAISVPMAQVPIRRVHCAKYWVDRRQTSRAPVIQPRTRGALIDCSRPSREN
jgi:hypothetical protein